MTAVDMMTKRTWDSLPRTCAARARPRPLGPAAAARAAGFADTAHSDAARVDIRQGPHMTAPKRPQFPTAVIVKFPAELPVAVLAALAARAGFRVRWSVRQDRRLRAEVILSEECCERGKPEDPAGRAVS